MIVVSPLIQLTTFMLATDPGGWREDADRARVVPWTTSEKSHYVRVLPRQVTGRRFRFGGLAQQDRA